MKVNLFQMMQKKCNLENLKNIFYYYSIFLIKIYDSKKVINIFNNNLIRNNTFIEIMKNLMYGKR